ncbi:MAG TPA: hypothetical protein PLA50_02285, partial [Bacteroidia bacterium]|nr:hypothetical protein [Bacteroidia bacterium]
LHRRLFRQLSRRSRRGDIQAGEAAIGVLDRANERGIQAYGIHRDAEGREVAASNIKNRATLAEMHEENTRLAEENAGSPDVDASGGGRFGWQGDAPATQDVASDAAIAREDDGNWKTYSYPAPVEDAPARRSMLHDMIADKRRRGSDTVAQRKLALQQELGAR